MNLRVVQFVWLNAEGEKMLGGYQLEVEKEGKWEKVPVVEMMQIGRGRVVEVPNG